MKKGFTLVELLAVIVILAIIALIATPIIINIINDAKEASALRSAEGYMRAVENKVVLSNLKEQKIFDGVYNATDPILKVEYSGSADILGTITVSNGIVSSAKLNIDNVSIDYEESKLSISSNNYSDKNELIVDGDNVENEQNLSSLTIDKKEGTNIICNNGVTITEVENKLKIDNIVGKVDCKFSNSVVDSVTNMDDTKNYILMLNNQENINEPMYIETDKKLVFNLNNKTLKGTGIIFYVRDGFLEINGDGIISSQVATSANGTIKKWNNSNSTLIINSTKCNSTKEDEHESGLLIYGYTHAIAMYDKTAENGAGDSKLLINGGCFISETSAAISVTEQNKATINNAFVSSTNGKAIFNWGNSTLQKTANLEINNSECVSENGEAVHNNLGVININNSEVASNANSAILNENSNSILNINGGTYTASGNLPVILNETGNINITNANVNSNYYATGDWHQIGIRNEYGTININSANVKSSSVAVYNNLTGIINIKDGEFYNDQKFELKAAIVNNTNGYINICGGKMSSGATDISQAYQTEEITGYIKYKSSVIEWINGSTPTHNGNSKFFVVDDNLVCE